jgi:hypothetical protein
VQKPTENGENQRFRLFLRRLYSLQTACGKQSLPLPPSSKFNFACRDLVALLKILFRWDRFQIVEAGGKLRNNGSKKMIYGKI